MNDDYTEVRITGGGDTWYVEYHDLHNRPSSMQLDATTEQDADFEARNLLSIEDGREIPVEYD